MCVCAHQSIACECFSHLSHLIRTHPKPSRHLLHRSTSVRMHHPCSLRAMFVFRMNGAHFLIDFPISVVNCSVLRLECVRFLAAASVVKHCRVTRLAAGIDICSNHIVLIFPHSDFAYLCVPPAFLEQCQRNEKAIRFCHLDYGILVAHSWKGILPESLILLLPPSYSRHYAAGSVCCHLSVARS